MKEVSIKTAEELVFTLNRHPNNFIFRGQADASWDLTSSLERLLENRWKDSDFDLKKFEDYSLKKFFGKSHLYGEHTAEPVSKLEKLALMQHYGAPTRLVDFTESSYYALYFALETFNPSAGVDFAIYAIDYNALMRTSLAKMKELDNQFSADLVSLDDRKDDIFDGVVDRFAFDLLWISEPRRMNKRLDLQAGVSFPIARTVQN